MVSNMLYSDVSKVGRSETDFYIAANLCNLFFTDLKRMCFKGSWHI